MLENGKDACNCKKKKCKRHGNCMECIAYHNNSKRQNLPFCKCSEENIFHKLFRIRKV